MQKTIDLFATRYIQITVVFMLFAYVDQYWHIPHSSWIIVTSALIYTGFNPGTVIKRAYMRFTGTITGIAAVVIVWHATHLDYRLAIFFLVFISWAMVFFQAVPYHRFMILATVFSDLSIEVSNASNFSLQFYIVDRLMSTAIVFGICILIERAWFGRSNLTVLNCRHLIKTMHKDLKHFYQLTQKKEATRAKLFREIKTINEKIARLRELINDNKYEAANASFYHHAEPIVNRITQDFRLIVSLIYLQVNDSHNPIISSIIEDIEKALSKHE